MGGGKGQKAKMAREKNLEKLKAAKGSQLQTNKKAKNIQRAAQSLHADIHVYHFRGQMQGTCRG